MQTADRSKSLQRSDSQRPESFDHPEWHNSFEHTSKEETCVRLSSYEEARTNGFVAGIDRLALVATDKADVLGQPIEAKAAKLVIALVAGLFVIVEAIDQSHAHIRWP